jgi:hypothetical protein
LLGLVPQAGLWGQNNCSQIDVGIINRGCTAALAVVEKSDGLVGHNPVHPGINARFPFKLRDAAKYLHHGILQYIVGIIMIRYHSTHLPIQPILVRIHQQPKPSFQGNRVSHESQDLFIAGFGVLHQRLVI